jgi:predicted amino acid dehydrogenase
VGGLVFGCLSETLLLGFAGHERSFARGPISCDQAELTLKLAERHGFVLGELQLDRQPHAVGVFA